MEYDNLRSDIKVVFTEKAEKFLSDNELMVCTRVWSAWDYSTMSEDDFVLADSDSDMIDNLAREFYALAAF